MLNKKQKETLAINLKRAIKHFAEARNTYFNNYYTKTPSFLRDLENKRDLAYFEVQHTLTLVRNLVEVETGDCLSDIAVYEYLGMNYIEDYSNYVAFYGIDDDVEEEIPF